MRETRTHSQQGLLAAEAPANASDIAAAISECVCSTDLLHGQTSVAIDHEGTRYVLRATRTGKLILTK